MSNTHVGSLMMLKLDTNTIADSGASAVGGTPEQTVTTAGPTAPTTVTNSTVSERLWAQAYATLEKDEPDILKRFKQDIIHNPTTQRFPL